MSMDSCFVASDTIINEKQYFEIRYIDFEGYGSSPLCYLREDTLNGRIYCVDLWLSDEKLVFDLSLNIGDTINIDSRDCIVDSINHTNNKKNIFLRGPIWYSYAPICFIEGVGSTAGMLGAHWLGYYMSVLLCAYEDSLNIYTHEQISWYPYVDSTLCKIDISIGIQEEPNELQSIARPNPFTTTTTIEYEVYSRGNIQYTVYNSIGETVFDGEERNVAPGKHSITLSFQHLPAGMYYVMLKSDDGVSVVKLLKQ